MHGNICNKTEFYVVPKRLGKDQPKQQAVLFVQYARLFDIDGTMSQNITPATTPQKQR